jgi:CheY-like chemotaxis protein
MKEKYFADKRILAVDDNLDVLNVMEEKALGLWPDCKLVKVKTYPQAINLMISTSLDLLIIDPRGIRKRDLLELVLGNKIPVVFLSALKLSTQDVDRLREKSVAVPA